MTALVRLLIRVGVSVLLALLLVLGIMAAIPPTNNWLFNSYILVLHAAIGAALGWYTCTPERKPKP
jgi:hypothetical protein